MDEKTIIERFEDLLNTKDDNSWNQWSKYTIKAIENLCLDVEKINKSRETMTIDMTEIKGSVARLEKALTGFDNFKEQVIVPLRIKVAVFSVIGGFVGGLLVVSWSAIMRFFVG